MKKKTFKMKIIYCEKCGEALSLAYTPDKKVHSVCLSCVETKQDFGEVLEYLGYEHT